MAVGTATWTIKRTPLAGNKYMLSILGVANGDASGGGISVTKDLSSYIPIGYRVTVTDAEVSQNNSINDPIQLSLNWADWEAACQGTIVGAITDMQVLHYQGYFITRPFASICPYYLGKSLVSTANFVFAATTNTNGKTYMASFRLLLEP